MSLTGNLEDLALPDILQIVSLSKRTGILTVESAGGRGVVIFKNGLVVSAISPSKNRKTLGQILLEQKFLSSGDLQKALEYQKNIKYEPLGSILIKQNLITYEILQKIVKTQIYEAISDLLNFKDGNFSFELSEIIPFDDIRCNVKNLAVLEKGISPQEILLDTLRLKDEEKMIAQKEPELPKKEEMRRHLSLQASVKKNNIEEKKREPINEPIEFSMVPIIIIDDDAIVRKKLYKELLSKGYDAYEHSNVADAIAIAQRMHLEGKKFGTIIDLLLPSAEDNGLLGGLEIIKFLKKIAPHIPILVITDYIDDDIKSILNSNDIRSYYIKPNIKGLRLDEYKNQVEEFATKVTHSLIELCRKLYPEQYKEPAIPLLWQELGLDAPFTKEDIAMTKEDNLQDQMVHLQRVLEELKNPNEAPEISLIILKYASEFFDRGLLFLVAEDEVFGLGGFGETGDDEPMPIKVRRIKIPLNDNSIFSKITRTRTMHQGKIPNTPLNRGLIKMLGNLMPTETALVPLISYGRVIAILYGDNAVNRQPFGTISALDIFMGHAGVAMENALLHKKINTLRIQ